MAESELVEQLEAESSGTQDEVVASTLEALQARVERADREALRGALTYDRASGAAERQPAGED